MNRLLVIIYLMYVCDGLNAQEPGIIHKKYEPTLIMPRILVIEKKETPAPGFWSTLWQRAKEYFMPTEQARIPAIKPQGAQRYFLTQEEKQLLDQKQEYIQQRLARNPQLADNLARLENRLIRFRPVLAEKLQEKGLLHITPQEIQQAQKYIASWKGKLRETIQFAAENPGLFIVPHKVLAHYLKKKIEEWLTPEVVRTPIQNLLQVINYHSRMYTYFEEDILPDLAFVAVSEMSNPEKVLRYANIFRELLLETLHKQDEHIKTFAPNLSVAKIPENLKTEFKDTEEGLIILEDALNIYEQRIESMKTALQFQPVDAQTLIQ
jgi:hypothetical protein